MPCHGGAALFAAIDHKTRKRFVGLSLPMNETLLPACIRLLVCGGREFNNKRLIFNTLDKLAKQHIIECIIEGDARGADRIAGAWAKKHHVTLYPHKITSEDWIRDGYAAGPIRNKQMLVQRKPHLVIAFPGGRGTADMIKQAEQAGVPVWKIEDETD